jgi:hypothetical protein
MALKGCEYVPAEQLLWVLKAENPFLLRVGDSSICMHWNCGNP